MCWTMFFGYTGIAPELPGHDRLAACDDQVGNILSLRIFAERFVAPAAMDGHVQLGAALIV